MSNESVRRRRKKQNSQLYWVVTWDKECLLPADHLVEANCPEQAEVKGLARINQEFGYGPRQDGGFTAVVTYTRADLLQMLKEMDEFQDET